MRGHLRIKSPWSQLALFLGLFGFALIVTQILSVIIFQANGIRILAIGDINWKDPHVITVFKVVQALSSVLMFMLPAFLYALFTFTGRYGYFLGFREAEKSNMYMLAIVGILIAM